MNRLIHEKSPYLLQHAENPVNWYPWGEAAFQRAERENKPVFLSIGYSTCHWCHVMAHESFEDEAVAAILNRHYVSVKVDREERPDVDSVYMAACQSMTGSGGWPLTVLMTPDQKPFWVGMYLPKRSVRGRMGLMELLTVVSDEWRLDSARLSDAGNRVSGFLRERAISKEEPADADRDFLKRAREEFERAYDAQWGGFGAAPKFPQAHNLMFLMAYARTEGDALALGMAEHTLRQMYRGGIFDHLGGGFSRYSTDDRWLVPHFEKMLYDNALLAAAYAEAYRQTGQDFYRMVARRTLDYVLRELTGPEGGFFCGQDADSGGVEGAFYVFTPAELTSVLGVTDAEVLIDWYGVSENGNFEGRSILNLLKNPRYDREDERIPALRERLLRYRADRTKLHTDDKALAAWNALMISALARAGFVLDTARYLEAAKRAEAFLRARLTDGRGRLYRRYRAGKAAHDGQLDDYAFYAGALLDLYDATFEPDYLKRAAEVAGRMLEEFADEARGGFFLSAAGAEHLIMRPKEAWDGAMPSGNSVAGLVLIRLSRLTGEARWRAAADRQMRFMAGAMRDAPMGYGMALCAATRAVYPEWVLTVAAAGGGLPDALGESLRHPAFHLDVRLKTPENAAVLATIAPETAGYAIPASGAAYYLCGDGACLPPETDINAVLKRLRGGKTG